MCKWLCVLFNSLGKGFKSSIQIFIASIVYLCIVCHSLLFLVNRRCMNYLGTINYYTDEQFVRTICSRFV